MKNKRVFIYLTAFSTNGGLEKFNRAFMKGMSESFPVFKAFSLHDKKEDIDERYISASKVLGGSAITALGALRIIFTSVFSNANCFIFGHVHLAPIAAVLKRLKPQSKIVFIAHGVEVWKSLSPLQLSALKSADQILAVSSYTKEKLIKEKGIPSEKIEVFHNTLDPFLEVPKSFTKPAYLQKRYGFSNSSKVIFTLCRLASNEAYKGYDRVVEALPKILKSHPETVYLIAGKYDQEEKERVEEIARKKGVSDKVFFTGFLKDEEIMDHYVLADLFVMPSKNEGFGIVYLEAMVCGLPVIAGNADGSVDALKNGELGTLVNPDDVGEIADAIIKQLSKTNSRHTDQKLALQTEVIGNFGFEKYRRRVREVLKFGR